LIPINDRITNTSNTMIIAFLLLNRPVIESNADVF